MQTPRPDTAPGSTVGTQTRHALHGRYPRAESVDDFRHNLALVRERMAVACQRVGRAAELPGRPPRSRRNQDRAGPAPRWPAANHDETVT